jgi:hypothetical protein
MWIAQKKRVARSAALLLLLAAFLSVEGVDDSPAAAIAGQQLFAVNRGNPNQSYTKTKTVGDSAGNIYVGFTNADRGLTLFKYDADGQLKWSRRYRGATRTYDIFADLAIDGRDNVYVSGTSSRRKDGWPQDDSFLTVKYSPTGALRWARRYKPADGSNASAAAMALDSSGNVFVTGANGRPDENEGGWLWGASSSYLTVKYSPEGKLRWARTYGQGTSSVAAIAVDSKDRVIVTGTETVYESILDRREAQTLDWRGHEPGHTSVGLTVKYGSRGGRLWAKRRSAAAVPAAIGVDATDNIYIAAGVIVKYDRQGNRLWVKSPVAGEQAVRPIDMVVEPSGHLYLAGDTGGLGGSDFATIKYDPFGKRKWARTFDGPGNEAMFPENGSDRVAGIATDGSGNVIVTGSVLRKGGSRMDFATIKYDGQGTRLWARYYDGSGTDVLLRDPGVGDGLTEWASSSAVDRLNNVYVTGLSHRADGRMKLTTVKYAP